MVIGGFVGPLLLVLLAVLLPAALAGVLGRLVRLSLLLSLCRWDAITPLHNAQWVGWQNYHEMFVNDQRFWASLRVTGIYSLFSVPLGSKRSLNASIDFGDEKQRLYGYKTLNLLNAHSDPSFLHTLLYSHIARQYLPATGPCARR